MSTTTALFKVDDVVVWSPAGLADSLRLVQEYGNGPFVVIEGEAVPTHCQYHDSYCRSGEHHPQCNVHTSRLVGHPQWVAIRLPDGVIPRNSGIYGGYRHFSGLWFAHAENEVTNHLARGEMYDPGERTVVSSYPGEEFTVGTGEYVMPGYPTQRA